MAANSSSSSFSFAPILLTIYILCLSASTATKIPANAVNKFCTNTTDAALCTEMASGAKTWAEAMTNIIKAVTVKVKAGKAIVDGIKDKLPSDIGDRKQTISFCKDSFDSTIEGLESSLQLVNKPDPSELKYKFVDAATFGLCTDDLGEIENGSFSEVNQFTEELYKLIGILREVLAVKPSNTIDH